MKYITYSVTILLLITFAACEVEQAGNDAEVASDDGWEPREYRTQYQEIRVSQVVSGLENPWAVAFLPDGRKLITERPGRLQIADGDQLTEVEGVPEVQATNQGGMMDVVLHPNYDETGWIYLTFSKPNDGDDTATAVVRGQLEENQFINVEEIFVQNRYSSPGRHYGSRIAFDNEGYMYVSIGDRGADPPRAQDTQDHAGTLLRLNDDGSVPDDNPFMDDPDVADEIFSYGHRNIQGLVINQENNQIWGTEHGPRGGDELNLIEATVNYGWPTASLGMNYGNEREFHSGTEARHVEGMEDPIYEFLPTLAPSGLALVTSDQFPAWEGNLLAGGLASERIRRLLIQDYEGEYTVIHDEELLLGEVGRIRDVRQGPDGFIYVLTGENPGALYMIEPVE
ncbi:MAG: PQQ-dependent sugar dehydrogenase [Balneolaceae bacterium]|nr:PQQ-dependent sugar dehydrogenase [Balneolaceae bacterium]